jgi:hypothetical protein
VNQRLTKIPSLEISIQSLKLLKFSMKSKTITKKIRQKSFTLKTIEVVVAILVAEMLGEVTKTEAVTLMAATIIPLNL